MKKELLLVMVLLLGGMLIGCANTQEPGENLSDSLKPVGVTDEAGVVVRSRALLNVELGSSPVNPKWAALAISTPTSITVVNAAAVSMAVDASQFVAPVISNTLLDFGLLKISDLFDNQLKVCGTSGKEKCGTALIRVYTTGQAGAGIFNALDNFGAPITAGIPGSSLLPVGLDIAGAAEVHRFLIPGNKHVLRLSDLSPAPDYQILADFTNAGAGTYSTTIVLEYALAP